ncbi:ABC transporter ATP-binding protein/permease [Candidatus Endomicrobiellum trichonymphae]|nr:ABC transporter ATP-binding protein/permease [Candidatus Endomicrobium trichonymphae]
MDQNPAIVDKPGAKVFRATEGIIKVNNVRFDYVPGFEILHGVILK